jgi:dihydrofolate reductase
LVFGRSKTIILANSSRRPSRELFTLAVVVAAISIGLGAAELLGRSLLTMTVSVFIGTSVDGFIARPNGDLDFLPPGGGEPHGYDEFMANIDTLVIGRKTFETVLTFPAWPYGDKRVVVLSSRPVDLAVVRAGIVEQMGGPPAEIVSKLAASGARHLYVDGGITIQRFLCAGLIQRLIITRVPVLIGHGISLFGTLPRDIRLRHISSQGYASGLVKSEYHVVS